MAEGNWQFPRTVVGGISLPRMLIGTNWILGYSHTGHAADKMIHARNHNTEAIGDILDAYLDYGIDAIMGPIAGADDYFINAIKQTEQRRGREIIMIDTPTINVDDNEAARKEARDLIEKGAKRGCKFCLPHHTRVEQLIDKNKEEIRRISDYLAMIRDAGMVPGFSAHMPEVILYSDARGYDAETYIQLFNCMGFLMQIEVETVARIIHDAKKPVMTIKPMAAGRVTPYVGLTFSFNAIRDIDMVTLGAFTPDEVHEDVEIARAALEHRYPNIAKRSSPAAAQALLK
ncbi:MAG: hypothetical protein FWH01_06470 [Oscillospiraceae bacterium]|nr:hypothetical protein [Oscillospiraceae bacterium]